MRPFEASALEETEPQSIQQRSDDIHLALVLTYITLAQMTIEGAASLLLGWARLIETLPTPTHLF